MLISERKDETILVIRIQSLQTLVNSLYCGLQWFQNSCNFRRVCDLHIVILPRVLLSFDFPLTYVRIFLLLYHLTFHYFCCYIYRHKTVHSMFHLTFLLATILICRSFFMSVDSLNLKSFSNFSVCKLRQWSLSEPFCSCLFLRIIPEEGKMHLVQVCRSLQKFRQNIRQYFHYKPSSRHQMFLLSDIFIIQIVSYDDTRNIKNAWSNCFYLFPKIFNFQELIFVCNWVDKPKRLCLWYIQLSHGWEWILPAVSKKLTNKGLPVSLKWYRCMSSTVSMYVSWKAPYINLRKIDVLPTRPAPRKTMIG